MIVILPPIILILQSAIFAKYLLWVAKIIILFLSLRLNRILNICLALSKSKLPVGSSANIISGSLIKALDIATL